jgi:hypothetical protein
MPHHMASRLAAIPCAAVDSALEGYPMEPAQAKPIRTRHRWLFVALLLVIVSGAAWWSWPRDERFVGKWIAVHRRGFAPRIEYLFRPNGTGTYDFSTHRKTVHRDLLWWTTDTGVLVRMRGTGTTAAVKDFAAAFYSRATSKPGRDNLTFLWDAANEEMEYDRTTFNREEMEQSVSAAWKRFDRDND